MEAPKATLRLPIEKGIRINKAVFKQVDHGFELELSAILLCSPPLSSSV